MNNYTVTLRHDSGVVRITTNASTAEIARAIVLNIERAPESAVLSVEGPL